MEKIKLDLHPRAFATGFTAGFVYIICAAVVTLWPAQTFSFFANWFHGIDLTKITGSVQLTFSKFIIGLLGIMLFFYIVGLVYGLFYKLCYLHCKKRRWI